jgi:hypothetical protein
LEADVAVFGCFGSNQQSFNCLLGSRHPGVQSVDLLESPHSGTLPLLFQLTDALGCGLEETKHGLQPLNSGVIRREGQVHHDVSEAKLACTSIPEHG